MTIRSVAQAFLAVAPLALAAAPAAAQQLPGEAVTFSSHGATLQGRFYRAPSPGPHPTAILFTGFPGNGSDVFGLGPELSRAGWNALFFNPRGFHGSEGEYTPTRGLEDAATALAFLRSNAGSLGVDTARIAAVGYSHGGWAALMTGIAGAPVRCVAAIAPDNVGLGGRRLDGDSAYAAMLRQALQGAARSGLVRGAGWESATAEMRARADDFDPIRHAAALAGTPVLVVGGWRDQGPTMELYIVPLVRALRAAGNTRVTPVTLDDDHTFRATRQELQRTVVAWLDGACLR